MTKPWLSVITPSAGRRALVERKLAALGRQTLGPDRIEMVLVDNACPEAVGDAVEAGQWPFRLRVLRSARRLSAADARMLAGEAATGRWLWLSDDDCEPAADAAAIHLRRHERERCVSVGSVRFVEPSGVRAWRAARPGFAQVTGVNTVLARADLLAVRPHIVRLPRPYGGEDTALGLALAAAGLPIVGVPAAWVDHHGPDPRRGGDARKGFEAGFNATILAAHYRHAAWALGVHPLQLALKRVAFGAPLLPLWRAVAARTADFEHAYYQGSRSAWRTQAPGRRA